MSNELLFRELAIKQSLENFTKYILKICLSCWTSGKMWEIAIAAYAFLSFLNAATVLLMWKTKWEHQNQRYLTINLAVTEMICCCYMAIRFSVILADNWTETWVKVDTMISIFLYSEHRLSLLHIIADRFLEIFMNMKYTLYMSSKKLVRTITCLWLFAFVLALTCLLLRLFNHPDTSLKLGLFTVCGLDVLIILLAVGTYTYFYLKVKKIRRSVGVTSDWSKQAFSLVWTKFKLPCYISLTYVFFNLISTIMAAKAFYEQVHNHNDKEYKRLMYIAIVLDLIGFASDIFIYVFVNRNVRKQLFTTLKWKTKKTNTISSVEIEQAQIE